MLLTGCTITLKELRPGLRAWFYLPPTFVLGNLMAFLTVNKVSLPADTLEELANQNTHKVGVVKDSAHELLFKVKIFIGPSEAGR